MRIKELFYRSLARVVAQNIVILDFLEKILMHSESFFFFFHYYTIERIIQPTCNKYYVIQKRELLLYFSDYVNCNNNRLVIICFFFFWQSFKICILCLFLMMIHSIFSSKKLFCIWFSNLILIYLMNHDFNHFFFICFQHAKK